MPAILLTRPKDQSERFARDLRARLGPNTQITLSPILDIRMLSAHLDMTDVDGLIFTSENGVKAYDALQGPGARAYCVGARTARAARSLGLDAVSADGNLQALIAMLEAKAAGKRLVHIRGRETAGEISSQKLRIEPVIAYDQVALPLNREGLDLLCSEKCVIVPLFSPRSARLFRDEIHGKPVQGLNAVCISPAVVAVLDRTVFETVSVSARMEGGAMIDEMAEIMAEHPLER